MKKVVLFLLSSVLMLGLFACSHQHEQANNHANQDVVKNYKQGSENSENATLNDVKEAVWSQLSSKQKEWIDGTWKDGKISKITLNKNMIIHMDNKSYEGEEVYLIDYPTKSTSIPNNMIVYADLKTLSYIGNGLVD